MIEKKCLVCGKDFFTYQAWINRSGGKFCSHSCSDRSRTGERNANWRGGPGVKNCEWCRKEYSPARPSQRKTSRFCSTSCKSKFYMYKGGGRELMQRLASERIASKKDTSIELDMQRALKKRGIKVLTHQPIDGICCPDIFIEPNIIVECDGDYWHSLPGRKAKDEAHNSALQKAGYKVFRFLGSEIVRDVNSCVEKIINGYSTR